MWLLVIVSCLLGIGFLLAWAYRQWYGRKIKLLNNARYKRYYLRKARAKRKGEKPPAPPNVFVVNGVDTQPTINLSNLPQLSDE